MAEQRLDIRVAARDEASGVFARIGRSVESLRGNINTLHGDAGLGAVDRRLRDINRLARVFTTMEVGLRAVAAAGNLVSAAFDASRGNMEAAVEAVNKYRAAMQAVPLVGIASEVGFGLGEIAANYFFPETGPAAMAKQEQQRARDAAIVERRATMFARMAEQASERSIGIDDQMFLMGVGAEELEVRRVLVAAANDLRKAEQQLYEARGHNNAAAIIQLKEYIGKREQLLKLELDAIAAERERQKQAEAAKQFETANNARLMFLENTDRDQLDMLADMLGALNPQEGRRAAVAMRYEQLSRQLHAQMWEGVATPEMIERAKLLQSMIPAAMAAELRQQPNVSPAGLAGLAESRFLTGVAQASMDTQQRQKSDQLLKETTEQTQLAKQARELLMELVSLYKTLPQIGVASLN